MDSASEKVLERTSSSPMHPDDFFLFPPLEEEDAGKREDDETPDTPLTPTPLANTGCGCLQLGVFPCLVLALVLLGMVFFGVCLPLGYELDRQLSVFDYHHHVYFCTGLASVLTITVWARVASGPRMLGPKHALLLKGVQTATYLAAMCFLQVYLFSSPQVSPFANRMVQQVHSMYFGKHSGVMDWRDVRDEAGFFTWLDKEFLANLFPHSSFSRENFFINGGRWVLSPVSVRALRVRNEIDCSIPQLITAHQGPKGFLEGLNKTCYGQWSETTEMRDAFIGSTGKEYNYSKNQYLSIAHKTLDSMPHTSQSTGLEYGAGGFHEIFLPMVTPSFAAAGRVAQLRADNWLGQTDHNSAPSAVRAVLVEVTLMAPSSNMWCYTKALLEVLPSGAFVANEPVSYLGYLPAYGSVTQSEARYDEVYRYWSYWTYYQGPDWVYPMYCCIWYAVHMVCNQLCKVLETRLMCVHIYNAAHHCQRVPLRPVLTRLHTRDCRSGNSVALHVTAPTDSRSPLMRSLPAS